MNACSEALNNRPRSESGFSGLMNRDASIGVKVSDTIIDTSSDAVTVTPNSRNRRPTMPPRNNSGMNTAISDTVIDTMVKPISLAPFSAAS